VRTTMDQDEAGKSHGGHDINHGEKIEHLEGRRCARSSPTDRGNHRC
jgi:hypothetical protein